MAFWNKEKTANLHVDIDIHIIPPQDFYDKIKECFQSRTDRSTASQACATQLAHTAQRRRRKTAQNCASMRVFKYGRANRGAYFPSSFGRYLLENGWIWCTVHKGAIVLNKTRGTNSFELRPDYGGTDSIRRAVCSSAQLVSQLETCLETAFTNTTTHIHLGKNVSRNDSALRFNMSVTN